ncbi:hypothetical protein KAFR_0I02780 [Kazachstania africana CBS 2517]|uniref:Ubiquitin-like domain-containing protein n=1 Tax=Kazachstania africana (strain ATCC 22294 / BCRC 22015 / CBS 2517 / CECT 1963 / NBRC 1671 / NRRL Y-8276) TaxID=1071382 RepID=H2B0A7_KAZAF|nr:hypothetical protein KAFR_0I02780 [Kazachstania africana CBS 2517]CCF60057.1 hypothetical protein KAFR_0I02780 [Kazachstania africana CBS 2517]
MKLYIKDPRTRSKFQLNGTVNDTVRDLKHHIVKSHKLVCHTDEISLIYSGKLLQDDATLNSLHLKDNAQIVMLIRRRPSPISDNDKKIRRLVELGFQRDSVIDALEAHNYNTEDALTELTTVTESHTIESDPTRLFVEVTLEDLIALRQIKDGDTEAIRPLITSLTERYPHLANDLQSDPDKYVNIMLNLMNDTVSSNAKEFEASESESEQDSA